VISLFLNNSRFRRVLQDQRKQAWAWAWCSGQQSENPKRETIHMSGDETVSIHMSGDEPEERMSQQYWLRRRECLSSTGFSAVLASQQYWLRRRECLSSTGFSAVLASGGALANGAATDSSPTEVHDWIAPLVTWWQLHSEGAPRLCVLKNAMHVAEKCLPPSIPATRTSAASGEGPVVFPWFSLGFAPRAPPFPV
jgi:hypothetical protein